MRAATIIIVAACAAAMPAPVSFVVRQAQLQFAMPQMATKRLAAQTPVVFNPDSEPESRHAGNDAQTPLQNALIGKGSDDGNHYEEESVLDQLRRIFRGGSMADPTACFCAGGSMCCPSSDPFKLLDCDLGSC